MYISVRRSSFEIDACLTCSMLASCSCESCRAWRNSWSGNCSISSRARSAALAWAAGDILLRSSENFLAIVKALLLQCLKVLIVEPVGMQDVLFVPSVLTGFVAAKKQDRHPARIEGVKDTIRSPLMLNAQLAHVSMLGTNDLRAIRERQVGALKLQQLNHGGHGDLLVFVQG